MIILPGCIGLMVVAVAIYLRRGESEWQASPPHGPRGGHVVSVTGEVGVEMELTIDKERRRMLIYVHRATTYEPHPLPIKTLKGTIQSADGGSFDVVFIAIPRSSDPSGSSSRFSLSLDRIPQQLLATNQYLLKLSYSTDGNDCRAVFPHRNDHAHKYKHD